jgi:hypothetical protein
LAASSFARWPTWTTDHHLDGIPVVLVSWIGHKCCAQEEFTVLFADLRRKQRSYLRLVEAFAHDIAARPVAHSSNSISGEMDISTSFSVKLTVGKGAIVTDEQLQAAGRVAHDNGQWSPRREEPGPWLLQGLVKCGTFRVGTNCHKMRGRNGTWHRHYYCRNHDPLRAGGEEHRCLERNIRADALDAFVFDHVRVALLRPAVLLIGEQAVAVTVTQPIPTTSYSPSSWRACTARSTARPRRDADS